MLARAGKDVLGSPSPRLGQHDGKLKAKEGGSKLHRASLIHLQLHPIGIGEPEGFQWDVGEKIM